MIVSYPFIYAALKVVLIPFQTNARLADYLGLPSMWNKTTTKGGTIKAACDYTMTVPPGNDDPTELYPDVAAVAATYGDPDGKYAAFLASQDSTYPSEAYFLWDQPLSDSNLAAATPSADGPATTSTKSGATSLNVNGMLGLLVAVCSLILVS